MQLADEIVELLSSTSGSLTDALLKMKVLLFRINQAEIVPWVDNELNGYKDDEDVPEYRTVRSRVLGNLTSIAWRVPNHPLPIMHLEKKERRRLETQTMNQSLAVLEELVNGIGEDGSIQNPLPLEYNSRLGETLASGVSIERAWIEIAPTAITQILTEVRSRLLGRKIVFFIKLLLEIFTTPRLKIWIL